MAIWIRSQNKEVIINTNAIILSNKFLRINGNFIVDKNGDTEILLGEYSTKEKALSVLDAIQECIIKNKENWLHSLFNEPIDDPRKTFVFQMLQDEEVEVEK